MVYCYSFRKVVFLDFNIKLTMKQKILTFYIITFLIFTTGNKLFSQSQFQKDTALINKYHKKAVSYHHNNELRKIYVDSLRTILNRADYPKGWMYYYNLKGNLFFDHMQLDSAKKYFFTSMKYASSIGDSSAMYKNIENIGMIYVRTSKFDSAKIFLNQTIRYTLINNDNSIYAKACLDLSQVYSKENNYNKSLHYILISDSIFKIEYDTLDRVYSLNSLAVIYAKIGRIQKSIEYYHLGILLSKLKEPKMLAYYYSNLGDLYSRILINEDSAIYYLNMSIELSKKYHMEFLYLAAEINLSGIYYHTQKYKKCIKILRKYFNHPNPRVQSSALINSGMAMTEIHNDSARLLLEKGIEVSLKNNLLEYLQNGYQAISRFDSLKGDYYNAYLYHLKYDEVIDTLYNRELNQTITALNLKNQLEKEKIEKENITKSLSLQNEIIHRKMIFNKVLVGATLILLIFLAFLLYLRRKRTKLHALLIATNDELQKNKLEIENKNQELRKLNETKNALFSIISHDLRSFIGTANQLTHVFYDDFNELSDNQKKSIVKSLMNTSDSVYNLTDNLLNWSNLQGDKNLGKLHSLPINLLITKFIESINLMAQRKNITLENLITDKTEVLSDQRMLEVILRNLIFNAIKFTPKNGKIIIEGAIKDGFYQICIKDNGIGIPADAVNKLFDVDSEYRTLGSDNENGTGFGLKLVKSMITKIGGQIWVRSEEGVGSEFYFTLKIANTK